MPAPTEPAAEPEPAIPSTLPELLQNTLGMKLVIVPKGNFWMSENESNAQKQVTIPYDFFLGAYEVTQGQWQKIMGKNPSWFSRDGGGKDMVQNLADAELEQLPVENVSWDDAQQFIKNLNAREKASGWVYRLPMEAEWEYACRGAASSREECSFNFYLDQPSNILTSAQANIGYQLKRTTKVGSYRPNRLGLYDMHGNVWEWCEDSVGASPGVTRGGSWYRDASDCPAARRTVFEPSTRINYLGLRLARVPVVPGSK